MVIEFEVKPPPHPASAAKGEARRGKGQGKGKLGLRPVLEDDNAEAQIALADLTITCVHYVNPEISGGLPPSLYPVEGRERFPPFTSPSTRLGESSAQSVSTVSDPNWLAASSAAQLPSSLPSTGKPPVALAPTAAQPKPLAPTPRTVSPPPSTNKERPRPAADWMSKAHRLLFVRAFHSIDSVGIYPSILRPLQLKQTAFSVNGIPGTT